MAVSDLMSPLLTPLLLGSDSLARYASGSPFKTCSATRKDTIV